MITYLLISNIVETLIIIDTWIRYSVTSIEGVECLWSMCVRKGNISTWIPIHCRWIHFIHSIDPLLHWYSISDNHLTIHQFDSFIQYKDIQFHYHSNDLQFIVMNYHQITSHDCYETLKIITHSIHDVLHDFLELTLILYNHEQIQRVYFLFILSF